MVRTISRRKKRKVSALNFFKIMNRFIHQGKKDFIYKIFLNAAFIVKIKTGLSFDQIFSIVFVYLRPLLQLKPLFSSGIVYQLPYFIETDKEYSMAVSWFYRAVSSRVERSLQQRITAELFEIKLGNSPSIKLKLEYYKTIVANRVLLYRFRRKIRY
jgi:ribosomal protein S7